jgi:hypothetical protein
LFFSFLALHFLVSDLAIDLQKYLNTGKIDLFFMTNRHIKTINGRKYYYESIRMGKKVTSKYLGPVERIRKKKMSAELPLVASQVAEAGQQDVMPETPEQPEDENYIG